MTTVELVKKFILEKRTIAIAESCTAGLIADLFGQVPGASSVLWGAFVCYTCDAKEKMLGVPHEVIKTHGAVSSETALAMLHGALEKSGADAAISVTGIAGPDGDNSAQPIGTVWVAAGLRESETIVRCCFFEGNRSEIRAAAANAALMLLDETIS